MAIDTKLMTAEEFTEIDPDGLEYELRDGVPVPMPPPGLQHAVIIARLIAAVQTYVMARGLGIVASNGGFLIGRSPDSVLAPDIAFVSRANLSSPNDPGYPTVAPDFVIEVVSPSDRAADVNGKVMRYLAAGTALVVTVWPNESAVTLHTPDGVGRTLHESDTLRFEPVLPELELPVRDIFS